MGQRGVARLPGPKSVKDLTARSGVEVWAYCLMPNHVHLVAVPHRRGGLARAVGEAHRRLAPQKRGPKRGRN
jgi:putative transposase